MDAKNLQELAGRHDELKEERRSWQEDWKTLARYFLPRKCRFLEDGERSNEGGLRTGSLDSTGIYAMRDLAAGLHGGMTSPARPWFRLSLQDPNLAQRREVREWLDQVERLMRGVLHRSNFYNAVHHIYGELGAFGTGFMFALPDQRSVARYYPLTVGEYCLDTNEFGRVDTVFRTFDRTLRQLVREFGLATLPEALRRMWDKPSNWNERFRLAHAVYPRQDRQPGRPGRKHKAWASVYYLEGRGGGKRGGYSGQDGEYPYLLSEGGFDEFPGFGPRWDVTGNDVYGRSPGMDTLPDCVLLHSMTATLLKALHKEADPPMVAPGELKSLNMLPGGANFVDMAKGQGQQIYPAIQTRPNAQGTMAAVAQIREQVREGLYANLFRMLLNDDRRNITATEIAAKEEEKLIMIGPVLERLHDELLTPLIDRTFNLMAGQDYLPPAPEDTHGLPLKVEFVSILAQAQKMVGTSAIERYVGFIGSLAQGGLQDARQVLNVDKLADAYGDYLGVPAEIINSQDERDQQREAEAQAAAEQEQAAKQADMAQRLLDGAQRLGNTPVGGHSLLDAALGTSGAGRGE